MTIYLLNSPVLTGYGTYRFSGPVSVAHARKKLEPGFTSAIGHLSTSELLSELFMIPVTLDRKSIQMQPGDQAVVFRLLNRLPAGDIQPRSALEALDYELGILERLL